MARTWAGVVAVVATACTRGGWSAGDTHAAADGPLITSPSDSAALETGAPDTQPATEDTWPPDGWETDPPDEPPGVFSGTAINPVRLVLSDDAWTALEQAPDDYVQAELTMLGETLVVGVRLKGSSTFEPLWSKPSLKVKVDHVVDGQALLGVEAFNLHNNQLDPSMMAETLAYRMFRDAGLPAPQTGYATLELQRGDDAPVYKGLYTVVEQKNAEFLDRWYESDEGSLYEAGTDNWPCDVDDPGLGSCFEVDLAGDDDGPADLAALCADAQLVDGGAWHAAMRDRFDWDATLGTMALELLLAHWDGYDESKKNYHLYHDPAADRWSLSPWSLDLVFGWHPWDGLPCGARDVEPGSFLGALASRCWAEPGCRDELRAAILARADALEASAVRGQIAGLEGRLAPYVDLETAWDWDEAAFHAQAACLDGWVQARPDVLRARYR